MWTPRMQIKCQGLRLLNQVNEKKFLTALYESRLEDLTRKASKAMSQLKDNKTKEDSNKKETLETLRTLSNSHKTIREGLENKFKKTPSALKLTFYKFLESSGQYLLMISENESLCDYLIGKHKIRKVHLDEQKQQPKQENSQRPWTAQSQIRDKGRQLMEDSKITKTKPAGSGRVSISPGRERLGVNGKTVVLLKQFEGPTPTNENQNISLIASRLTLKL